MRRIVTTVLLAIALAFGAASPAYASVTLSKSATVLTTATDCLKVTATMWWTSTTNTSGHMEGKDATTGPDIVGTKCTDPKNFDPWQLRIKLIRLKQNGTQWFVCTASSGDLGDGWVYNHSKTATFTAVTIPSAGDSSPCGQGGYRVQANGERNNGGWLGGIILTDSKYFF